MEIHSPEQCFIDGELSGFMGGDILKNPFLHDTAEYDWWLAGWINASEVFALRKPKRSIAL